MNAVIDERQRIEAALSVIPADVDRDTWVRVAMALKSELGNDGFDVFDAWSQSGASYDPSTARATWRSLKQTGGVTIGTLYALAKEYGYDALHQKAAVFGNAEIEQRRARRKAIAISDEQKRQTAAKSAATLALAVWNKAAPARDDHPYLTRKGLAAIETLREIDVSRLAKLIGYRPLCNDGELIRRVLIAPVHIAGALSTIEMIDEDGRKTALGVA